MTAKDEQARSTAGRSLRSGRMLDFGRRCWAFLAYLLVLLFRNVHFEGTLLGVLGGIRRQRAWRSDLKLQKLALGTWNVTSLKGKELELVRQFGILVDRET